MHTRLTFAAKAEQPAIFVRNEDGTESLLNFSMDEGDVILHRVARRFILRRGNLAGCVVNKGFVGSGERLKSNTVSRDVERASPGSAAMKIFSRDRVQEERRRRDRAPSVKEEPIAGDRGIPRSIARARFSPA